MTLHLSTIYPICTDPLRRVYQHPWRIADTQANRRLVDWAVRTGAIGGLAALWLKDQVS